MVSLSIVSDSFYKGISLFMNTLENFFAPFVVIILIVIFFLMQYFIIRMYGAVISWIANTLIPLIMNIHFIAHNYEKFRELTSTGLFNDKSKQENKNKL